MDFSQFDYLIPLLKKYWLVLLLALLGLIFFIYGLIALLGTGKKSNAIKFETNSSSNAQVSQNLITVDVEGSVVKAGVYRLKENSIMQDALIASGGMTADADRDFVAKNLNLALKLADGQKIYIPAQGENAQISNSNDQLSNMASQTSLININSALADALDSLPGIGPVTAAKIINGRPYVTINSLLEKKAVSQKVFDQIKDKIIAQ